MDIELFKTWLLRENYRASTARKSSRDIGRLRQRFFRSEAVVQAPNDAALLGRYRGYLEAIGTNEDGFDSWVRQQPLRPRKQLSAKRKPPQKQSFTEEDWRKLVATLQQDETPEGTVLWVMAATGLRIGDILRLSRRQLKQGTFTDVLQLERKGGSYIEVPIAGAPKPWLALRERWTDGETVAQWICPSSDLGSEASGGAYQRVRRHLRELATELELSGQLNLHRLRRTVGVRALRKTGDIHAVSQLLGHRSLRSTEQYVSELRTEQVADLQRQLLED